MRENKHLPLMFAIAFFGIVSVICILLITGVWDVGRGNEPPSQSTPEPDAVTTQNPPTDPTAEPTAEPTQEPTPEPDFSFEAKALYLTGSVAGNNERLQEIINIANTTELNALVIDVKSEEGLVNYVSSVPAVKDNGFYSTYYDVDALIEKLHANGIYVIGRIVCFKDDKYPRKYPEYSVKRLSDGTSWQEPSNKSVWFNPYKEEAWEYNISIALEAIEKGFDEIQFDYVRFPTITDTKPDYGDTTADDRHTAIDGFLKRAHEKITLVTGTPISADAFGTIYESALDAKWLGQVPATFGQYTNWICPMIYPSHYANDSNGWSGNGEGSYVNAVLFTKPDLSPYDVVYNAMQSVKKAMAAETHNAKARPYIQAFTASYLPSGYYMTYDANAVRQQVQAVYDAGFTEWILWDASCNYKAEFFLAE